MARYTQKGRPLSIRTPLGDDALLLEKLTGSEGISQPYCFQLHLLAELGTEIAFDRLLGQRADVHIAAGAGGTRKISGILNEVIQEGRVAGPQGSASFIRYRATLVPEFWLLTQRIQSRVFQNVSVWQIVKTLLQDEWRLRVRLQPAASGSGLDAQTPRDYCVQFQESDFAFLSRIMEAEGLYYYFRFDDQGEEVVVTDAVSGNPEVPAPVEVPYRDDLDASRTGAAVREWHKRQSLRASRQTVRDYSFEMPQKPIEKQAPKLTPDQVKIGKSSHALNVQRRVNDVDLLDRVEYPAGFAHFFTGTGRDGAPKSKQTDNLFPEAERWLKLRREEEAAQCLLVSGGSDCANFLPGHRFALTGHFDAAPGEAIKLLLTRVEHEASIEGAYMQADGTALQYRNRFDALPESLPYRPTRTTPRPRIDGFQTATVVGGGPAEAEVFVDAFGRVKVKFPWDRRTGAGGPESSCWVRVAQVWAGKKWGAFFWPRVGNEVVVVFEEGDPDRPLIVGCVYNADNMPPFDLPQMAMLGGFRSRIFQDANGTKFNAILFHDIPGVEYVQTHSEKNDYQRSEGVQINYVGETSYRFRGRV